MTSVLLMMLRRILPDVRFEALGEGAFLVLSSLLRFAQRVHVSRERISWDNTTGIKEDTRLLGGCFAECDRDWNSRRKFCSKHFDIHGVQTRVSLKFEFPDSFVDLRIFDLIVSRWRIFLQDYLNGQPIRIMARILLSEKDDWKDLKTKPLLELCPISSHLESKAING